MECSAVVVRGFLQGRLECGAVVVRGFLPGRLKYSGVVIRGSLQGRLVEYSGVVVQSFLQGRLECSGVVIRSKGRPGTLQTQDDFSRLGRRVHGPSTESTFTSHILHRYQVVRNAVVLPLHLYIRHHRVRPLAYHTLLIRSYLQSPMGSSPLRRHNATMFLCRLALTSLSACSPSPNALLLL
jgi:hypothetical protein